MAWLANKTDEPGGERRTAHREMPGEDRGLDSGWQDLHIPHGHGGSDAGASLSSRQHPLTDGDVSKQC